MPESEDKPESQARAVAFERRLQELGWISGRNLQIDYRWGMGEVEKARGNRRLAEIDTKRADRRCKPRNRSDAADDPHDPDRLRGCQRTGCPGPRCEPRPSRWQPAARQTIPKAAIMATRWRTNSSASAGSRSRSGKNIQQLSDLTLLVFKHYRKWGVNL